MKIQADTSIFGGVFDKEFSILSKKFFRMIDDHLLCLATSSVVEADMELPAQES